MQYSVLAVSTAVSRPQLPELSGLVGSTDWPQSGVKILGPAGPIVLHAHSPASRPEPRQTRQAHALRPVLATGKNLDFPATPDCLLSLLPLGSSDRESRDAVYKSALGRWDC